MPARGALAPGRGRPVTHVTTRDIALAVAHVVSASASRLVEAAGAADRRPGGAAA